jgi:hypothetical protein
MNKPRPVGLNFVASGCLLLAGYSLVLLLLEFMAKDKQPQVFIYLFSMILNSAIAIGIFQLLMWARYFMMFRAVFTILKMPSLLTHQSGVTVIIGVLTVVFCIFAFLYLLKNSTKQLFEAAGQL